MKKMALIMAMAVLVCWLPGQLLADTYVMWDLNGVTFTGGGTATGDFTYDATTQTITSWDISASQGTSVLSGTADPHTFSASASASVANEAPDSLITLSDLSSGYPGYYLSLEYFGPPSKLGTPGSLTLLSPYTFYTVYASPSSNKSYPYVSGGSLTGTALPLPPSAFLLGSGLIALVWTRRKKRLA